MELLINITERKFKDFASIFVTPKGELIDFYLEDHSLMEMACRVGNFDLVRFLLENFRIDIDSSVHIAAENGQLDILRYFKSKDISMYYRDICDRKPLHYACEQGHLETVKFLIENGSDTDSIDCYGDTSLRIASSFGRFEVVKYLCSKGADIEVANKDGEDAISAAQTEEIKEYLRNNLKKC
jgi:uncharacterized protein